MHHARTRISAAALWAFLVALCLPLQAQAIVLLPPCTKDGNCGISDILAVLVNVAELLLSISGAVALLFFVYGGFTLLTSAGRTEEVAKGKTILRNAVIGIGIIFLSGVIVRFTTQALTGGVSRIPTVGESCAVGSNAGIYISIPAGIQGTGSTTVIPESIECIPKDNCESLNNTLKERSRPEAGYFHCVSVDYEKRDGEGKIVEQVRSCVRGLCVGTGQSAGTACCLCADGSGNLIPCPGARPPATGN